MWNHHEIKISTRKSESEIESKLGMVWPQIPECPNIDRSIEDERMRRIAHLKAIDEYLDEVEAYGKKISEGNYMLNDIYEVDSDLILRFEFSSENGITTMLITAINKNGTTGREIVPWFFAACTFLHAVSGEIEVTDADGWEHYVMTYEGFATRI